MYACNSKKQKIRLLCASMHEGGLVIDIYVTGQSLPQAQLTQVLNLIILSVLISTFPDPVNNYIHRGPVWSRWGIVAGIKIVVAPGRMLSIDCQVHSTGNIVKELYQAVCMDLQGRCCP